MTMINKNKKFNSIGIDIFKDYLAECKKNSTHDELVRCDIRFLPFRDNSVEVALCCEVIEHLQKNEGVALLKELERIASKKVVVTTPVGFKEELELEDNVFQRHLSGWRPKEFEDRGYAIRGQGTKLSGENVYKLRKITNRTLSAEEQSRSFSDQIMLISSIVVNILLFGARPFVYFKPTLAAHMFCVKEQSDTVPSV